MITKTGRLAPVAVLREAASMLFTCESCKESGVGDTWMYEHEARTHHGQYEAATNPWP